MKASSRAALASISLCAITAFSTLPLQAQTAQGRQTSEGTKESSMKEADKDMARVLAKLEELGAKPLGTQSVEETRKGPTPADAVKALMKESGKDPEKAMADMKVSKQDIKYSGPNGDMPARVYKPEGAKEPLPIIVYYHGGGWVIADLDTYEASAMALAKKANAMVISVEYRHAPEQKFPEAHEDAIAAYAWILRNAQTFGGDVQQVALAGESAGGNLAFNVAAAARQGQFQKPAHLLLIYPVAGVNMETESYRKHANAAPLGRQGMQWFVQNATKGPEDLQDPRLDIVGKADFKGLPGTTIITAEIDPLMSEGKALAEKMKAAGVDVTYQNYEGVAHEFFGMAPVVADAEKAQDLAARELRQAFQAGNRTGSTGGSRSGDKGDRKQ
jgi:acetyl esterase/lipase